MKVTAQIIAIVVAGYIAELYLPWYSIAFVAFAFGYLLQSNANFLGGLVAIALLWGIKIWMIESTASADLASKVASILPLKEKWILIAITLFLGGLVGGFAALTGSLLKKRKKKRAYTY